MAHELTHVNARDNYLHLTDGVYEVEISFVVSSQIKLAVEIPVFYEDTTAVRTNHRLSDRC